MASSTAYQGAYSTHLQERRQVRRLRWRELRPWFGNVGYSQPYLVLDLGQFTARCRWCLWQSAPCGALDEAQFAYGAAHLPGRSSRRLRGSRSGGRGDRSPDGR